MLLRRAASGSISAHRPTREFVGAPVEISCGWTTRQGGERTSLEDLVAQSDWAMLESRHDRQATFGLFPDDGA